MRVGILLSCGLWACIAMLASGCAVLNPEGFGFNAGLGMHAVHERQESTVTHRRTQPLKCVFFGGEGCESAKEVRGS